MLKKKLIRTALKYKAQFLSMIIMVALGVGIFVGFNAEWKTIEVDVGQFLADTNYADIRVYSQSVMGFTKKNLEAVKAIEGVQKAARFLSVNVDIQGREQMLALTVVDNYAVSTMAVTSGAEYDPESESGIWLSDQFAEMNGISIGDDMTLTCMGKSITGQVAGLAKSGEYMICVEGSTQLMPDYTHFGFAYISPAMLKKAVGMEYYSQIHLITDLAKEEIEPRIRKALGVTALVLSKDEHMVYAEAMGEAKEGKTMASVLPVLFLLIAILTMVTTMHRITANEKTQIGALKALGFRDKRIARHYTSYGLMIGLVGSILGVALGYGIAYMIMNPQGMMGTYFDMTDWTVVFPWFNHAAVAATVLSLTLISFLSVKKMLRGTAADALRPYVPRVTRRTAIERTRLWEKLPFGAQWNLRDVLRHKSRSAMTLVGVVGCMLLLVGALGMVDTMDAFMYDLDHRISHYETKLNLAENADTAHAMALSEQVRGDWQGVVSVDLDGEAVSAEVYSVTRDKLRFLTPENDILSLGDDGAYICQRLADKYKIGDEITFSPFGSDKSYTAKVAGVQRSMLSKNIVMTQAYADSLGLPYTLIAIYTDDRDIPDSSLIASRQAKKVLMESYDSFMEMLDMMVILLVVAAVVLGVVVLYNLGVMSYIERTRELATLKVIGFRDRHIGRLLISQNVWLTLLGVALGLPAGVLTLKVLLIALAGEYELSLRLGVLTYTVSVLTTFGVSLAVGWMIARKNRKIDMVEAMKTPE